MKLSKGCVLFSSVTYQPSHPFSNANIKVKERWRMQWNQRVTEDVSLVSENMAKLL